jgi:serine/threonine-protein kinase
MPKTDARIGRYEVAGRLATGGMAELFFAWQTGPSGFERPVVIKRVLSHLARERDFRDMFLDEARFVVQICHPNVV